MKYGNDNFWCFIEDGVSVKDIAIWKRRGIDNECIIAKAVDKYEARSIVDALLNYVVVSKDGRFGKKELVFLDFVCANCIEPYSTMAANAIMWNDRVIYEDLKNKFPTIYDN